MKIIVCGALLLLSVVLALCIDEQAQYTPEYDTTGVRTKRSAALPFLVGVAAGGFFGPIIYNRLYGWGRQRGWSSGPKITFYRGWRPASSGWQPAQSQGWQPAQSQGWQSEESSSGWEPAQQSQGWQQEQPAQSQGWKPSGNDW